MPPAGDSAHAAGEQHGAGDGATAVGHRGDLRWTAPGPHHLALAPFAAQLDAGFVNEPEAVQAAAGELPAGRVEWEQSVPGDGATTLNERSAFAPPAESQGLEPDDGEDGEAVVELGGVDVGGLEVGALPHGGAGIPRRHGGHVVELIPTR